jgi:hypothetical protein
MGGCIPGGIMYFEDGKAVPQQPMVPPGAIGADDLRELCALTVELTRLRQNECKHLCIENFAPGILQKLIQARLLQHEAMA